MFWCPPFLSIEWNLSLETLFEQFGSFGGKTQFAFSVTLILLIYYVLEYSLTIIIIITGYAVFNELNYIQGPHNKYKKT